MMVVNKIHMMWRNIMLEKEAILTELVEWCPKSESSILEAYELASYAHKKQKRPGGEPYILHPLRVALQVARWGAASRKLIVAALLHDVVEDNPNRVVSFFDEESVQPDVSVASQIKASLFRIRIVFGEGVAGIVCALTHYVEQPEDYNQRMLGYYFYLNELQGREEILVKAADLQDNMSRLHLLPARNKRRYGRLVRKYSFAREIMLEKLASFASNDDYAAQHAIDALEEISISPLVENQELFEAVKETLSAGSSLDKTVERDVIAGTLAKLGFPLSELITISEDLDSVPRGMFSKEGEYALKELKSRASQVDGDNAEELLNKFSRDIIERYSEEA